MCLCGTLSGGDGERRDGHQMLCLPNAFPATGSSVFMYILVSEPAQMGDNLFPITIHKEGY